MPVMLTFLIVRIFHNGLPFWGGEHRTSNPGLQFLLKHSSSTRYPGTLIPTIDVVSLVVAAFTSESNFSLQSVAQNLIARC